MSNQFDWRTEDEAGWEAELPAAETAVSRRRVTWWLVVVLILLAIAGGYTISQQVSERVDEATARILGDVTAVYRLVNSAGHNQDVDLFMTALSGRDPAWTDTLQTLVEDGQFHNRPAFGLTHLSPIDFDLEEGATTISPDLESAEVTATLVYETVLPDGERAEVTLQQTAVYRLGTQSWLLSPPLEAFWGSWLTYQGDRLTVVYPERDRDLVVNLASDLDDLLQQMCAQLTDLDCPANLRVRVRLDTDAGTLLHDGSMIQQMDKSGRIVLPTPTLVGLPQDDAGYEALLRGYAAQIATATIVDLLGDACCRRIYYVNALLNWQLYELGLRPWPPEPIDYPALQQRWVGSSTLNTLWGRSSLRESTDIFKLHLYSLFDMLHESTYVTLTPVGMIAALEEAENYRQWLQLVTSEQTTTEMLETEWGMFVFAQAGVRTVAPASFPAGTVSMVCNYDDSQSQVVQFNPETAEWSLRLVPEFSPGRTGWVNPLPLPDTYAIYTYDDQDSATFPMNLEVQLWQNGRILHTLRPPEGHVAYFLPASRAQFQYQSQNRYLAVTYFNNVTPRYELLDMSTCRNGRCRLSPLPGLPTFSPDGEWLLLSGTGDLEADLSAAAFSELVLTRSENLKEQVVVGNGRSPLWLTANRYIFIRPSADAEETSSTTAPQEVVTAVVDQETPETLLTSTDLLALLPEPPDSERTEFFITDLLAPNKMIVQVLEGLHNSGQRKSHLFLVQLKPNLRELDRIWLISTDYEGQRSRVQPSPSGDWLGYFNYIHNNLEIARVDSGEVIELAEDMNSFDWLTDNLLVISRLTDLQFITPLERVVLTAPHGFGYCWDLQWQPD